jgi:hypothetical protein
MEARSARVDRLVALGEPRLDAEVLPDPDQGVEQVMLHL